MSEVKLEDIVSLAKRRGFIYPGSEVYGGLSGTWDYGPLGVALKRNILQLWWRMFVEERDDMLGVDAAILMNQKVWQASGHTATFTDPVAVCLHCNTRSRVDKIIDENDYKQYIEVILQEFLKRQEQQYKDESKLVEELKAANAPASEQAEKDLAEWKKLLDANVSLDVYKDWLAAAKGRIDSVIKDTQNLSNKYGTLVAWQKLLGFLQQQIDDAKQYVGEYAQVYLNAHVKCPSCGSREWNVPQKFNMMFKTHVGPVQNQSSVSYLRPETAQGIFTNFKNVVDSFYPDVPFGLAQQGKAFRNEISPRDFIFRSREFEQMEIEYFVHPDQWENAFEEWVKRIHLWCDALGLPSEQVHELEVPAEDRAHYSKRTVDFEFDFPIGREELLGLAYRTDFDLMNIQRASGKSMEYRPKDGGAPFVPHVIEPSFGVERALMAVLTAAYTADEVNGEKRIFLKLPAHLAPVKVAVLPLAKNKPELVAKAREVYAMLKKELGAVMWVDTGNIGKNYRKMDEIGVPYCITVDFETLEGDSAGTVTVRHRDTTDQERVSIGDLLAKLS